MTTARFSSSLLLVTLALLASNVGLAAEGRSPAQHVTAHRDYYVLEGIAFDSLDALETVVSARQPIAIELDACGPSAARAWKAAVYRFSAHRLAVQLLDGAAPRCTAAVARRVNQPRGPLPTGIDEAAVERYWRQVAP